jgi:hypothetical protein
MPYAVHGCVDLSSHVGRYIAVHYLNGPDSCSLSYPVGFTLQPSTQFTEVACMDIFYKHGL